MQLIKLDAIDSTNEFLKGLSNNQVLENFTVVTAEYQTNGKGQMGAVWNSETGKNLIMSVLVIDFVTDINQIFNINGFRFYFAAWIPWRSAYPVRDRFPAFL